eukprot:scaffold16058_cov20-Tisochrysis_lutea.AAC.1
MTGRFCVHDKDSLLCAQGFIAMRARVWAAGAVKCLGQQQDLPEAECALFMHACMAGCTPC